MDQFMHIVYVCILCTIHLLRFCVFSHRLDSLLWSQQQLMGRRRCWSFCQTTVKICVHPRTHLWCETCINPLLPLVLLVTTVHSAPVIHVPLFPLYAHYMQNGDTPLILAVQNGHLAIVKMLIVKYQCSANETNLVIQSMTCHFSYITTNTYYLLLSF